MLVTIKYHCRYGNQVSYQGSITLPGERTVAEVVQAAELCELALKTEHPHGTLRSTLVADRNPFPGITVMAFIDVKTDDEGTEIP